MEFDDVQGERDLLKRVVLFADRDSTLDQNSTEERRSVAVCRSIERHLLRQRTQPVENPDDQS